MMRLLLLSGVLEPSLADVRHGAWITVKWLCVGGMSWAGWRYLAQPVFDVQVDAANRRNAEKFATRVHDALDASQERTDARMLASVQRNAPAWAAMMEAHVYPTHLATRRELEAKVSTLAGEVGGNTRTIGAVQDELREHSDALARLPDIAAAMRYNAETLGHVNTTLKEINASQMQTAEKIGALAGEVSALRREWDGRERREQSEANAARRAHFDGGA